VSALRTPLVGPSEAAELDTDSLELTLAESNLILGQSAGPRQDPSELCLVCVVVGVAGVQAGVACVVRVEHHQVRVEVSDAGGELAECG